MTIRILTVQFDQEIRPFEVPAFRGAVISKVGRDNPLFHNHRPNQGFYYRYPLIQYKRIGRKPAILCIQHGVDEIHRFFEQQDWSFPVSGRQQAMGIERLHLDDYEVKLNGHTHQYQLQQWLGLNQKNFTQYLQMARLAERLQLLEKVLTANILAFAKGIDWTIKAPVKVAIEDIMDSRTIKHKQQKLLTFRLRFSSNMVLPPYIGLGKSASTGFGMITN